MAKAAHVNPPRDAVRRFFARSDLIDHDVLRPLAHVKGNWDVSWDTKTQQYEHEEDSFAKYLNILVDDIAETAIPARYHDNEDVVANYLAKKPGSKIEKKGGRWIGEDYGWILEQGGFHDFDQAELLTSAIGRVGAALKHGQIHYDQMDQGHRLMLADVLTIILYHRSNYEPDDWSDI